MQKIQHIYRAALLVFLLTAAVAMPSFALAISATINIPKEYSQIKAGGDVYFETDIKWPENNGRKDLRIEYSVLDKDGNEVAYAKVLKAVETQASFMDFISIPESVQAGMYKINAKLSDYQNLNQEITTSFYVVDNLDPIIKYAIIFFGIIGLIGFVVVVELFLLIKKKNIVTA